MKRLFLAAVICGIGWPFVAEAQEGLAMRIAEARKANAAQMKQYSWQSRTELIDNGKVADTRIDSVTYGPNNQLQRTVLNDQSSPLPRGFLRRRIGEGKGESGAVSQGIERATRSVHPAH